MSGSCSRLWRAAPAALLFVLALPFLGRAYHIDDPLYLDAARHLISRPLDPLGAPTFWHDRATTYFFDSYNPPLTAYLLTLPVGLGGSEWAVHLLMMMLAGGALALASRMGEDLGIHPRFALLLAASPVLTTAAVSGMSDVPFLLVTLLAWWFALRSRGVLAGSLVGLSALAKYAGLINVLLSAVALWRKGRAAVIAVGVAVVVFAAWCLWNLRLYGALHVLVAGRYQAFSVHRQTELVLSFVAGLGLAGLPAALGLLRWRRSTILAAAVLGLLGAWIRRDVVGEPAGFLAAWLAFAAGLALLLAAARATRNERDTFLRLCFWTYLGYAVLLVYFGAARYLLPCLPPLLWLLVRNGEVEANPPGRRFALSLTAGAIVSIAVGWADAGYAGAWRGAAERLPRASRGFVTGHWGFQWYAGQRGYRPLEPREELRVGDVVAEPQGIDGTGPTPAQAAVLAQVDAIRVRSPWLRVMDRGDGAGFYSSAWGLLPLAIRPGAVERVTLRSPSTWLLDTIDHAAMDVVTSLDLGSPDARHVLLDGWSGDESFQNGGDRVSFAWAVGPASALRVPLPAGARRIGLRAFPSPEAVGRLRMRIGSAALATIDVRPGWRSYETEIEGEIDGGLTTIVLEPAGFRKTGPFGVERRPLAIAIDFLALGCSTLANAVAENHGTWAIAGPALLVTRSGARLSSGPGRQRYRFRIESEDGVFLWQDGRRQVTVWSASGDSACARRGCEADMVVPGWSGRLVLRSERAVVRLP